MHSESIQSLLSLDSTSYTISTECATVLGANLYGNCIHLSLPVGGAARYLFVNIRSFKGLCKLACSLLVVTSHAIVSLFAVGDSGNCNFIVMLLVKSWRRSFSTQ